MDKHVKFTIIDRSCSLCGKYAAIGEARFYGDKRMHPNCRKKVLQHLDAYDLAFRVRGLVRNLNEKAEKIRTKGENK